MKSLSHLLLLGLSALACTNALANYYDTDVIPANGQDFVAYSFQTNVSVTPSRCESIHLERVTDVSALESKQREGLAAELWPTLRV